MLVHLPMTIATTESAAPEAAEAAPRPHGPDRARPSGARTKTALTRAFWRYLPTALIFLGVLAAWQLVVTVFGVREYILPSPAAVWHALVDSGQRWGFHMMITTAEVLGGFVIAGVVGVLLGTAIAWSDWAARALMPFLVFVNTLPKVAIAPLILLWFGYGIGPNMLIGAIIGFFSVVINTAAGLSQIDQDMIDLGRVFNAPKWRVFVKIRIPNAYPYILSALKITATSAVVGAILGEFVASQKGLGYVIITTQSAMNTPVAFAAVALVSVIGLALFGIVAGLARLLAPWAVDSGDR
jgi:NitT/TauT family transport system permease protein